jgi:hypothetical protein
MNREIPPVNARASEASPSENERSAFTLSHLRGKGATMSIKIVYAYPSGNFLKRFLRSLTRLLGALLIVAGVICATAPMIYLLAVVFTISDGKTSSRLTNPGDIRNVALGTALTVTCLWLGQKLYRGKRRLVLFLRRFGFTEATQALTYALSTAMGSSWRLVTLDDHQIAPVGIGKGGRWLTRVISVVALVIAAWGLIWVFGGGLVKAVMGGAKRQPASFGELIGMIVGEFAAALVLGSLALLMVSFFAGIALYSLSAALSVRRAEKSKKIEIDQRQKLEPLARVATRRGQKIFSPRLIVVRVATAFWQETVRYFIGQCSAVVIDISEPSENLLWEISTLKSDANSRWILVGESKRLERMVAGERTPLHSRMFALLDGEEVIAYGADRGGKKRFARALRARLETIDA